MIPCDNLVKKVESASVQPDRISRQLADNSELDQLELDKLAPEDRQRVRDLFATIAQDERNKRTAFAGLLTQYEIDQTLVDTLYRWFEFGYDYARHLEDQKSRGVPGRT